MAAKTGTYTLIASNTLTGTSTSITFSSIPATYTDLVLVTNVKSDVGVDMAMRYNSDTGTNYSYTYLTGDGTTASSGRRYTSSNTLQYLSWSGTINTNMGTNVTNINDYSNTTTYKTTLIRNNNASAGVDAIVGLYRSTSAISSINIIAVGSAGVFQSGSTFKLYGIEAGNL